MKKIFIIIPSASLDSPIRGACALANELSNFANISLVSLKGGDAAIKLINKRVEILDLGKYKSWYKKFQVLKKILNGNCDIKNTITISIGLSADILNRFCVGFAITCSSIRGDLPKVYLESFGRIGRLIAYFHLRRLRKLTYVVSMTTSMSNLIKPYIGKDSPVIGNFIDELPLEKYRRRKPLEKAYKFIYTGSLISGKQPIPLIGAIGELLDQGIDVELDILGDGPLLESLKAQVSSLSKPNSVNFYGFLEKPYSMVSNADVLVMPSLTEGVSRSVLEALYLGIPCVLRDIDGTSEIIESGINGEIFQKNSELSAAMLRAAKLSRTDLVDRKILTSGNFRQKLAVKKYINLFKLV